MTQSTKKVQRGFLYMTDGRILAVHPLDNKKFDYTELQLAVQGCIESVLPNTKRAELKGCRQMFANEDGLQLGLPQNPLTQQVCNMVVYNKNGYGPAWRVRGNIIALVNVAVTDIAGNNWNNTTTIAEALHG